MKIRALIARLAATTTATMTDNITIATTMTATTTDSTTVIATTTVVSTGTADVIGQMDSNLVSIAAADQITSSPTSMSHAQSVTTTSSTKRFWMVRAPCTRTPNTR